MAIDIVMPQMGESIAEGTVSRWLKKVGDAVERDEPILEISTDKVDAEIPSPAAGTLVEILANEGDTVEVNSVIARIAGEGEEANASPSQPPAQAIPEPTVVPEPSTPSPPEPAPSPDPPPATSPAMPEKPDSMEERRRTKSSPLVRKIAKENEIDIAQISGTGVGGRVTKDDILGFMSRPSEPAPAPVVTPVRPPVPVSGLTDNVRVEALSVMRRRISEHMVLSKRTSAHVTTVFEIDFTNIDRLRKQYKAAYAGREAKLTYLTFVASAVIQAIREFPILNSSTDGENVYFKTDINLGIAVGLDWGLIVPVVRRADGLNLQGLARAISDLGERARTRKLNPDDVQGGTFTITNPGMYGGLFGTPIINQPQVAILGMGGVKKRPMVLETADGDTIAIRSMCILALSFDHRLIDGAVADQFMARIKAIIESAEFSM